MPLEDGKHLLTRLKWNFGSDFIVTLAPVYSPMVMAKPTRRQANESRIDIHSSKGIDGAPNTTATSSLHMTSGMLFKSSKAEGSIATGSKRSTGSQDVTNDKSQDEDVSLMKEQPDAIDPFDLEDTCSLPRNKHTAPRYPPPSSNSSYEDICSRKRSVMYQADGPRKRNLS